MSEQNYRLYAFANYYLSPLQAGLQTAHLVGDLANENSLPYTYWSEEDKTIIILNGGNSQQLIELSILLERCATALKVPSGIFHEDKQSLNGAATVAGIILPEEIWDAQYNVNGFPNYRHLNTGKAYVPQTDIFDMLEVMRKSRLF